MAQRERLPQTGMICRESKMPELKAQALDAVKDGQFQVHLQFVVEGNSGRIAGAEALSRWDHPQMGLLYPQSYIGLMEKTKIISELDFYMLEEACRLLELWQGWDKASRLSCNIARITLESAGFPQRVEEIAGKYSFEHSRLILEITEDILENDRKAALRNVSQCKEMGFRLALDDLGGGFTNFFDLQHYPADIAKIDRSILGAAVDPRGAKVLQGMIDLVHRLDMVALCEGVETEAQVSLLRQMGCDFMQGFHFYRPLPKEEANRIYYEQHSCAKE